MGTTNHFHLKNVCQANRMLFFLSDPCFVFLIFFFMYSDSVVMPAPIGALALAAATRTTSDVQQVRTQIQQTMQKK